MSKIKISVIVPIYNRAAYLPCCLDSLAAQSLQDVEFLLIDDGSRDQSGEICEAYAAKDSRFRVTRKENGGLSSARNAGLEQARGDYIMFVDSDDRVEPDFCARPLRLAEENGADLVMFSLRRFHGKAEEPPRPCAFPEGPKSREEAIRLLYEGSWNYVMDKLFARALFDGIRFPLGRVYEDVATTYRLVLRAQKVYFCPEALYWYRRTPGSIVTQRTPQTEKDRIHAYRRMYEDLRQAGISFPKMETRMDHMALIHAVRCACREEDEDDRFCLERLGKAKRLPNRKAQLLLWLYRHCPRLFHLLCRIFGKRIS